ncbi:MAG: DUF1080 domain-containing protein [Kiritimatiellaeota bacterium]|nr:DUF1080 domain-containing protein [Kiritimatiellota bacterium]
MRNKLSVTSGVQTCVRNLAVLGVALCALHTTAAAEFPAGGYREDPQWRPVRTPDLIVQPGTALDFSVLADAPAGKHGPVIINPKGQLAFAARPDQPVRFLCLSTQMPLLSKMSAEDVEVFADQVQRAGYNALRTHNLDQFLMIEATADGEPNPSQLALWDSYAAAMKKRGIYLYLDLTTYGFYLRGGGSHQGNDIEVGSTAPQLRIYWEPALRETCAKGIRALLKHVNPQTGLALKDDPQVLVMQFRNESSLSFCLGVEQRNEKKESDPLVVAAFRTWLKKRYRTTEALRRAWSVSDGKKLKSFLKAGQMIDDVELPSLHASTLPTDDLYRFTADAERETVNWFLHLVKDEIGVRAPITDYTVGASVATDLARTLLPVVDNHSYHEHPTAHMERGSRQEGESTIASAGVAPGDYLRKLAGTRHLGAPFLVSEIGQPFWNPWRHESGLFMPAIAGLQDWQLIQHHGGPVMLHRDAPLRPFDIALDPPRKTAERMKLNGWYQLPGSLTQLALLAGFGVRVDGVEGSIRRAPYRPDLTLTHIERDSEGTRSVLQTQKVVGDQLVSQLRQRGVLSAFNRTDIKAGIYESDTGQMKLDAVHGVIEVVTPRSEGATLTPSRPTMELPTLAATGDKTPAAVFLGSLDGKILKDSERMLLMVVSDAKNTGMSFAEEQQQTLEMPGGLPVLARVVNVVVSVKNSRAGTLKMWALAPNGTRSEEIPLETKAGRAVARIDTGRLAAGPTPYFEIVTTAQTITPAPKPAQIAPPQVRATAVQPIKAAPAPARAISPQVVPEPQANDGRISLFDGKTLNGWHFSEPDSLICWSVDKGELTCLARKRRVDLISDKLFKNFELQLEFLMEDASNSGVYLRGLYELQLIDDSRNVEKPKTSCGAIFGQIAPSEQAYLGPGRWNTLNVKMVGQSVTVTMNGKCVIDQATIRKPTDNKYASSIKEGEPGPIILQCWKNQFRFRNISIKKID